MEIAGALRGDDFDNARCRSRARRPAASPGILHGQEGFLSGKPAKLAVGFGSESSKTRSAVSKLRHRDIPVRILRWKRLAADGLHPKAVPRLPVVVPPPLPVTTRAPDPLAELGSRSGNALISTLVSTIGA
jgi:hypothetical protein